jgi:hypothetical protein
LLGRVGIRIGEGDGWKKRWRWCWKALMVVVAFSFLMSSEIVFFFLSVPVSVFSDEDGSPCFEVQIRRFWSNCRDTPFYFFFINHNTPTRLSHFPTFSFYF